MPLRLTSKQLSRLTGVKREKAQKGTETALFAPEKRGEPERQTDSTHRVKASLRACFDNPPLVGSYAVCVRVGKEWRCDVSGQCGEYRFFLSEEKFQHHFEEV